MKTRKIIFIVLIGVIALFRVHAQDVKTTMGLLCQSNWTITLPLDPRNDRHVVSVDIFTPKALIERSTIGENSIKVVVPYYLSDRIETRFDKRKIGKVQNGKYLILRGGKSDYSVYEILKLTTTEFEYVTVFNSGRPDYDYNTPERRARTLLYKAIPK